MKAFPDFTHVALDLTKYYANDFSDRDLYTVFDCEAVLADSGKKLNFVPEQNSKLFQSVMN